MAAASLIKASGVTSFALGVTQGKQDVSAFQQELYDLASSSSNAIQYVHL